MKKSIYLIVLALILGLVLTGCSLLSNISQVPATEQTKVKPPDNLAGAGEVPWNLSGDVMPVPPYGSMDIPGSDTASKLIVNQPNGNVEVAVTGVMKGLDPNKTYFVILSSGYTPYLDTGWDVSGSYVINVEYLGTDYPETLILTQDGEDITGISLDTIPPGSFFTVYDGTVVDNVINIYANKGSLVVHMVGTIGADGSMSGDWADEDPGTRTGTWASTGGAALKTHTGDTGFPGDFNNYPRFTFLTDEFGAGSWHFNLRNDDFPVVGRTYDLSVWINGAGRTILISDTFTVEVD